MSTLDSQAPNDCLLEELPSKYQILTIWEGIPTINKVTLVHISIAEQIE